MQNIIFLYYGKKIHFDKYYKHVLFFIIFCIIFLVNSILLTRRYCLIKLMISITDCGEPIR